MKKVVALLLSVVLLLSVTAFADTALRIVPSVSGGITVLQVTVDGKTVEDAPVTIVAEPSQLVKDLTIAIEETGMAGAFGSALENADEYKLLALQDFSVESVNADMVADLAVPGITAESEVVALLGFVNDEGAVGWDNLEVISVSDGVMSIAVTEKQIADAQDISTVIAILVK